MSVQLPAEARSRDKISTTATGVAATTPPYLAPVSPEMRYRYMDICYPRDRHRSTPAIMLETTSATASTSTPSTRRWPRASCSLVRRRRRTGVRKREQVSI